ncbi:hypothetical protein HPB52_011000 [Rhipicephalus sanguineus]|uniref:DM10 domain-containing protein n=1 Tax=Rhipicephalus sanguineus TaxID=34632 RepID=A0A9D4Q0E1_RHISA|nr:hypothetical protein HPB52_011000 [Rhipicephalus sanguineus]
MSLRVSGKKYSFLAEWNDASTYSVRSFILNFFTRDSTVEMSRRVFLRRTECVGCALRDLFAGNVVAVLSRHLRILGYADAQTAAFLAPKHERTVLVLRPANLRRLGDVWAAVEAAGATVCKSVMLQLTPHDVKLLSANPQEARHTAKSMLDLEGQAVSREG